MFIEARRVLVRHPERGIVVGVACEEDIIEGERAWLVWIAETVRILRGEIEGESAWIPVKDCEVMQTQ